MTESEFLTKMQEDILDVEDPITMDQNLTEIEDWDSLAFVNFLVMANSVGKSITRQQLKAAVTVSDLFELLK